MKKCPNCLKMYDENKIHKCKSTVYGEQSKQYKKNTFDDTAINAAK